MQKLNELTKLLLLFVLVLGIGVSGCKDDDDDPDPSVPAFTVLKDHLISNGLDVTDVVADWITSAEAVADQNFEVPDYFVMDLRSATDFAAGHIKGAVNTTLANVLTTATGNAGKPILVVCYTGQTAGHAVVALRLSGYPDAKVLKWGMSSWNSDFDKWTPNISSVGVGHTNWSTAAVAADMTFADPVINSTKTTGAEILAERVNAMLTGGFKGVNGSDVLATPGNYFINNFWDQADVDHYGHIAEAFRIKPLTLAGGEYLKLNPDAKVVTYCWTGQTSSMMTAYLTVLGYDSNSLKFGVNSMIYDNLEGHKWTASLDYDFE
jgi:rhodanese-related sulfurtransferase